MQSHDESGWPESARPEATADIAAWTRRSQDRDPGSAGAAATTGDTTELPVQDDAGEPDPVPSRKSRSLLVELPVLIVVALVIALVIKSFVVQAFFIPTGSMQDTLELYDKVLVNKLVYHFRSIEPGDIVVFNGDGTWNASQASPAAGTSPLGRLYDDTLGRLVGAVGGLFGTPLGQVDYVKRVIGVPGDHVRCCDARGLVTVNGVPLNEQSYLYPGDVPASAPAGIPGHFNVTVPPGYLWVLGDHRSVSDDSRGHEADPGNGLVLERQVIGRAFAIVWPPSRWQILRIPPTFGQPGVDRPAAALARGADAGAGGAGGGGVAGAGAGGVGVAGTGADGLLTAALRPEPSYLPLTAGFALALPVTWLQRRSRRRFLRFFRRRNPT